MSRDLDEALELLLAAIRTRLPEDQIPMADHELVRWAANELVRVPVVGFELDPDWNAGGHGC